MKQKQGLEKKRKKSPDNNEGFFSLLGQVAYKERIDWSASRAAKILLWISGEPMEKKESPYLRGGNKDSRIGKY